MKNTTIIYLGYTTNLDDPRNAVTLGTSTIEGMACREWSKHMKIFWVHTCDGSKTKGGWDYWENKELTPWIDCLIDRTRVRFDTKEMAGRCNGRTNNWWLLTVEEEDLINHVKEKINRG